MTNVASGPDREDFRDRNDPLSGERAAEFVHHFLARIPHYLGALETMSSLPVQLAQRLTVCALWQCTLSALERCEDIAAAIGLLETQVKPQGLNILLTFHRCNFPESSSDVLDALDRCVAAIRLKESPPPQPNLADASLR